MPRRCARPGTSRRHPLAAAAEGSDHFYRGGFAQRLVDAVQAMGGVLTRGDLESYQVVGPQIAGHPRFRQVLNLVLLSLRGLAVGAALADEDEIDGVLDELADAARTLLGAPTGP